MSGRRTLAVEAATYVASVALLDGEFVLDHRLVAMRGATEERLMPAIVDVLGQAGVRVDDLAAIACGSGPGSFTSLRIAASLAKGLSVAGRVPLFAMSSLTLIVAAAESLAPGAYLAQLDAMRGDVYVQRVRVRADRTIVEDGRAELLTTTDAVALAARDGFVTVGGAGASISMVPDARGFAYAASLMREVDVATWEPEYGRMAEAQVQWERRYGIPLQAKQDA